MDILRVLGLKGAGRVETDLSGAKRLALEERERRLRGIYPDCARLCAEALEAFSEIRRDCDLFERSRAEVSPDLRSSVRGIARKMRENFIARVRAVTELGEPPGDGYAQFAAFSRSLQEAVAKIAKINYDNRYIFELYKEDMARFRKPFERANAVSDELKGKLDGRREEAERLGRVVSLIGELEGERERIARLGSEIAETEGRLAGKRSELAGFGENPELGEKRGELSKTSVELASASGRISASVSVLDRALRKYGRICDPSERPERYAEAPLAELLREGKDYPELKGMLARMKALIAKGELGLKNPGKVGEQIDWLLSGNLTPLLDEYAGLGERRQRLEKELEPLRGKERDRQGLESAISQLAAKLEKQERSLAEARSHFSEKRSGLEKEFREVAGGQLVLGEQD